MLQKSPKRAPASQPSRNDREQRAPLEPFPCTNFEVFLSSVAGEAKKYGINTTLICCVLDGDNAAIDELSVLLTERLLERNAKKTTTQTRGLGIPDSLANYLTAMMVEAVCKAGGMPRSLAVLVRNRLCSPNPRVFKTHAARQTYLRAAWIAAQLDDVSVRKLARIIGVSSGQAGKWRKSKKFRDDVEYIKETIQVLRIREIIQFSPPS